MVEYDVWETGFASLGVVFLAIIMTYGTYLTFKTPIWDGDAFYELSVFKALLALLSITVMIALFLIVAALGLGHTILWAFELLGFIHVPQ